MAVYGSANEEVWKGGKRGSMGRGGYVDRERKQGNTRSKGAKH